MFEIKSWFDGKVLFSFETVTGKLCVEEAVKSGANLSGAKLVGERPVLMIGPVGSRAAYLTAFVTDQGVKVTTGCFSGNLTEFRDAVQKKHAGTKNGEEYMSAIGMIETHARIWNPCV